MYVSTYLHIPNTVQGRNEFLRNPMVQLPVHGHWMCLVYHEVARFHRSKNLCRNKNSNLKKIHSFNCSSLLERNHSIVPLLIHFNTGKFLPDNHGPFGIKSFWQLWGVASSPRFEKAKPLNATKVKDVQPKATRQYSI